MRHVVLAGVRGGWSMAFAHVALGALRGIIVGAVIAAAILAFVESGWGLPA